MICLHCGDCCLRMSPLGSPCPKLDTRGDFYFCKDYENRPEECTNHRFPFKVCPIGREKLNISTLEEVRLRVETGYAMLKYNTSDSREAINFLYQKEEKEDATD